MNTPNDITFNGAFRIKKATPKKRQAIESILPKKDAKMIEGFKDDKSVFVVVNPIYDELIFNAIKKLGLAYVFYPQIRPNMNDINTNIGIQNRINTLVADESKIKRIMNQLRIRMEKYAILDNNNGKKTIFNPTNKDTVIISPSDKNGANYVEYYKGLSTSSDNLARRFSVNGDKIHEYNYFDDFKTFNDKVKNTLIVHHN